MSPRRTGLPTFAPSSVIVEFHEFSGRWFVTDQWGSGSGSAVRRRVRKATLGKTVLNRVESARRHGRPARSEAEGADLWARFCVEEAGVQVNHYQPEKRLVLLAGKTGIRCYDARQPLLGWQPLPASSPRALGKALIKRIIMHEPSVPAPEPADSPTPDEPG